LGAGAARIGWASARCLVRGVLIFERPLTVESLSELRSVLEDAAAEWRDLVIALGTESMY